MRKTRVKPFLKWAGGKARLLPELLKRSPASFKKYGEPFLGGGALFFALAPETAILSDINAELINLYLQVRDYPEALLKEISHLPVFSIEDMEEAKTSYLRVRKLDRSPFYSEFSDLTKAARMLWLNKTCYNGLHRVNKQGQFNTPCGRFKSTPVIAQKDSLTSCSEALKGTKLMATSYRETLPLFEEGDFVYLDPPYVPLSKTSNFTGYTSSGFGGKQQKELKEYCDRLSEKGVLWMLSNSDTPLITDLYRDYTIEYVRCGRAINSNGNGRVEVNEILVRNYS